MDERIKKLASNLVNYSCRVKKGEKVLISCTGTEPLPLVRALVKEVRWLHAWRNLFSL